MSKKKYVFISNIAAPYQVKFCYALQEYFDAEFWFYEHLDETRPDWWKIPLGDKCKILKTSGKLPKLGYYSFGLFSELMRFKPDIIVLGGFMKWHWLVLKIAKLFDKKVKVIVMTEPLRYVTHDDEQSNELITRENSSKKLTLANHMFKNIDLYLGMSEVAEKQLVKEFKFAKDKVDLGRYPQDIEEYFNHPLREKSKGEKISLLFANRLVDRYNPLFALEVYQKLKSKYPNIVLNMNSDGALKATCMEFIMRNNLKDVTFLDKITSWNKMHLVYKKSDILILPAIYSNGNLTIMEAKASGMGLVISNRINDVEKDNINEESCYICELNINHFVESIEKYILNPELLISHGKLNRELVEERRNINIAKYYYDQLQRNSLVE
ncbi:glycosyltransferase family 4 protein [Rummeliibacillus sp. JY-2-4R]